MTRENINSKRYLRRGILLLAAAERRDALGGLQSNGSRAGIEERPSAGETMRRNLFRRECCTANAFHRQRTMPSEIIKEIFARASAEKGSDARAESEAERTPESREEMGRENDVIILN